MNFKHIKYNAKYIQFASKMMGKTWDYDKSFENIKNRDLFYNIFFQYSFNHSNYYDLIIDENDKLVGLLMAGNIKNRFSIKNTVLFFNVLYQWIIGNFGRRISAINFLYTLDKESKELMKNNKSYDHEIKLFFVDESTRGNGLGKKMMNRYIEYCKEKGINRIILLTDAGCNYGFYDYYGFKRINEIHSNIFAKPEKEYNGYAYAYEID